MTVPFVDLKENYLSIKDEILKEIAEVLDSANYVLGPKVKCFEEQFAIAHQVKHTVALSSGTAGNHVALWALGIKPGDEVIIPVNTFISSVEGAILCGAKPVFVDCEKDSYTIDKLKIEEAITDKTKAIVAVHLYGHPADMDAIKRIAKKYHLFVIEDAAQAHLAEYCGKKVGGLADIASFSFYPSKNLGSFGEGGAITTNDLNLANISRKIREHGSSKKYYHEIVGHNYRMDAIQGAVLGIKLKYLEKWNEKRRNIARKYNERLKNITDIKLPIEMNNTRHVYHLYVIQVPRRDKLQEFLTKKNIGTGLHYPLPLHLQKCFSTFKYKSGDFPQSEKLAKHCISLPIYPEMKDEEVEYVVSKVLSFF